MMLEAVKVSKAFEGKPVICNLSLRLEAGRHYVLMGPSGCGKTTLLNLFMGLLKPDAGEIRGPEGLKLSAVFQENRLLEQLSGVENVALATGAEPARIKEMLYSLGLPADCLDQPVGEYSGGMKRRTALARALLADYDVLFLDEPFKGLDEETRETALEVMQRHTQGKTLVMVTHDPREARGMIPIAL